MTREQLNKLLEGFEGYLEKAENLTEVHYSAMEIYQPAQMPLIVNIEFDNAENETDTLEVRVVNDKKAEIWGYPNEEVEGLDLNKEKLSEFFY
jgi:hypothetical protein